MLLAVSHLLPNSEDLKKCSVCISCKDLCFHVKEKCTKILVSQVAVGQVHIPLLMFSFSPSVVQEWQEFNKQAGPGPNIKKTCLFLIFLSLRMI